MTLAESENVRIDESEQVQHDTCGSILLIGAFESNKKMKTSEKWKL